LVLLSERAGFLVDELLVRRWRRRFRHWFAGTVSARSPRRLTRSRGRGNAGAGSGVVSGRLPEATRRLGSPARGGLRIRVRGSPVTEGGEVSCDTRLKPTAVVQ